MSTVVVTGVAGYIGGEIALLLKDAGHTVVGIDRRPLPGYFDKDVMSFLQADFDSDVAKQQLLEARPDAIIHCAGTSLVGPSLSTPCEYYNNNVVRPYICWTLCCKQYQKLSLSLVHRQQYTGHRS